MKDLSFYCIPSDGFQTLRNPGQLFTANILDSNQLAQRHRGTGEWKSWDFRSSLHAFGHSLCSIVFLHIDSFRPDVGFPGDSVVKNLLAKAGDTGDIGLIPGSGGGNGNPLQYSWLGNPMDRWAWQAIVHSVAESGLGTEHARMCCITKSYLKNFHLISKFLKNSNSNFNCW